MLKYPTAKALGGAIYHQSIDRHDYLFSRNCFIKFECNNSCNVSFSGNRAASEKEDDSTNSTVSGDDMFVTTLLPCDHRANNSDIPIRDLEEIFESHFEDFSTLQLATSGAYFDYDQNDTQKLAFTPGNITKIPFTLCDDMGQEVDGVFHMSIDKEKNSTPISVDCPHVYTSDNAVSLKGKPGGNGTLRVTKIGFREVTLAIPVTLRDCPPFFQYKNDTKKCVCALEIRYKVVRDCNDQTFESKILHGYWGGYYNYNNTKADNFWYGICPRHYCFKEKEANEFYDLPSNDKVEKAVCGVKRQGILCGRCKEGYCMHYHSPNFRCGGCDTCPYGWILFLVSEILPLTLLFVFIISLNISFTSGYLNGFIFFSQVFDSVVTIHADVKHVNILIRIVQTVYKLFNFDFFSDDDMSLCLWKKAQTMHLLAFRFVTVAIAAALVVITVLLMKCCARNGRFLQYTKSASIIHGLSAFLVVTYTQCTNISFQLLNYSVIYDLNRNSKNVLFYQGDIKYFGRDHAPYAFMAIFCLSTLTLVPPLFLITYPLCYRIGALLKLTDTRFSRLLEVILPLSKLKPVFDSFQGCYKDEYRFFAGLYFVYRILLLASVLTSDPIMTFIFTQVLLCLMLTIHCMCQPYVKRAHNIIDGLFFLNCSVVNIISVLGYYYGLYGQVFQDTVNVATYAQLLFIYAPFFYLVIVIVCSMVKFCRQRVKNLTDLQATDDIIIQRLGSSDEEEEATSSTSVRYRKFSTTY